MRRIVLEAILLWFAYTLPTATRAHRYVHWDKSGDCLSQIHSEDDSDVLTNSSREPTSVDDDVAQDPAAESFPTSSL